MARRGRGMAPFKAGALTLAIAGTGIYFAAVQDVPFVNEPYEVRAVFRDSSGIKSGSPVRIAGKDVGAVTKVERPEGAGDQAVVTFSVEDRGRPLKDDARVKIRPRIFLEGNFFLDVTPGTPQAGELDEGATIPATQTANPVQLGEVLTALKGDVRRDLATTFQELGNAQEAGGARALNASLPDQEVAYRYSAIVSEALLGENAGDLGDFIRDQGRVAKALTADRRALRDLVTNFNRTFAAVADREADLRAAVGELPRTLETAQPALASLNAAFPSVRRFAAATRPAVRSTGPTVDAVLPFLTQLQGLVGRSELRGLTADLRRAIPGLAQVAATSVPLLEQLRLFGSCQTEVVLPGIEQKVPDPNFPATGPAYAEFFKGLVGLAGESRSFDANGPWFKVLGQGGLETVSLGGGLIGVTATPFLGVNPPVQRESPPLRPDVPCETQEPPNLETVVGAPPASRRIDTPAVRERVAKSAKAAAAVLNERFKREGSNLRVGDRMATEAEVRAFVKRLGLQDQLERLQAKTRAGAKGR
jgi:phospholipid/cholesterol/gamma-HCH transport system substrate-binding protein